MTTQLEKDQRTALMRRIQTAIEKFTGRIKRRKMPSDVAAAKRIVSAFHRSADRVYYAARDRVRLRGSKLQSDLLFTDPVKFRKRVRQFERTGK